jgi:hypothetical protein
MTDELYWRLTIAPGSGQPAGYRFFLYVVGSCMFLIPSRREPTIVASNEGKTHDREESVDSRNDAHAPLHRVTDRAGVAAWISRVPGAPILMDALFASQDEEYLAVQALERLGVGTD